MNYSERSLVIVPHFRCEKESPWRPKKMPDRMLALALTVSLHWFPAIPQGQPAAENLIHVQISGLRNDEGQVVCSLFSSSDFPKKAEKAVAHAKSKIVQGHASCEFPTIVSGNYAVSVFHDEN